MKPFQLNKIQKIQKAVKKMLCFESIYEFNFFICI